MNRSPSPLLLTLAASLAFFAASTARAGSVALMPDGVLTPTERDEVVRAVRDAGHTLLEDSEVVAAVEGARAVCSHDDTQCLARVALLADAEVVVAFARRGDEIDVVAVDAGPRVGRATAPAAHVARAVIDAIASRGVEAAPAPGADAGTPTAAADAATPTAAAAAAPGPVPGERVLEAPAAAQEIPAEKNATDGIRIEGANGGDVSPTPRERGSMLPLAGAGLAGAGVVALIAGGYAAVLAGDSMAQAEAARFQDDSARFGDAANGQLWLTAGAFTLGFGAVAGGAALVFVGGEP